VLWDLLFWRLVASENVAVETSARECRRQGLGRTSRAKHALSGNRGQEQLPVEMDVSS
jgi:hypothetical protein